jgi:hypothetical protein
MSPLRSRHASFSAEKVRDPASQQSCSGLAKLQVFASHLLSDAGKLQFSRPLSPNVRGAALSLPAFAK